jgi:hypothetical protein
MAGPSIAVRVLGDLTGLGSAFKSAGDVASGAASKIHSAFGGMLDTLNKTGVLGPFGDALSGINDAIGKVIDHGKDIGPTMMAVGGAIAGVGGGLQVLGSKDQAAHQQLQASVTATGADYEDFAGKIESAIKHQEHFGDTAGETQDALGKLTQATHDPQKALDLLSLATDVAAAKHEDLTTAATQVGKVYNGNTKLLKEYGISIDKTTGLTKDGKTATEALAQVTAGQASAAADTFMGKLKGIRASVEDSAAAFGQKYGPAITAAGAAMTGLGAAWQIASGIKEALTAATEAGTVADAAAAVAEWASLAPILLIIAAIAILGVAIYELVTHWSAVWSAMKDAAEAVWTWIKANWPLLLAILLGPFGVAALEISRHWQEIKDGAKAAVDWVTARFHDLVGFFTGLPGQLAGVFSHMWDGIESAFRSVLNGVIDLWNRLHFTLPHIDLGPLGSIGGGDIGVPHIPHLAQGGLMTRDGLVFAHAGEVISPAPAGARGPAVRIEHFHASDGADIDLLLRHVAFASTAGRL